MKSWRLEWWWKVKENKRLKCTKWWRKVGRMDHASYFTLFIAVSNKETQATDVTHTERAQQPLNWASLVSPIVVLLCWCAVVLLSSCPSDRAPFNTTFLFLSPCDRLPNCSHCCSFPSRLLLFLQTQSVCWSGRFLTIPINIAELATLLAHPLLLANFQGCISTFSTIG